MPRLIILMAVVLAGCASQVLEGYVGQPLQAMMVRNGPPTNAFDMPDGRRAFQWSRTSEITTPVYRQTSGNVSAIGNTAWWTQNTTITGGQSFTQGCVYTVYGRWREESRAWIIEGFEPLPYACEDRLIS